MGYDEQKKEWDEKYPSEYRYYAWFVKQKILKQEKRGDCNDKNRETHEHKF